MTFSTTNIGDVVSGELSYRLRPKINAVSKRGVMYCHGAGSNGSDIIDPYGKQGIIMQKIAADGYNSISGMHGGMQTWGNASALNAMTASYNDLQVTPGTTPGKVALISASMGGLAAFNWAAANPTKVSCIVATIPVINLTDIKVNNRTGYAFLVDAAYGGTYTEAGFGAIYNPQTLATANKLANIPTLIFYGTTDTTCIPSETIAFANKLGSFATLVPINSGHEIATFMAVNEQTILDFVRTNN